MKYSADDMVEIKIKEKGKTWEETPVSIKMSAIDASEVHSICQNIADTMGKQVRWNWGWSYQGHYLMPNSR